MKKVALRSYALLTRQYDDRKVLATTVDAWGRALWLICPQVELEPSPYGKPYARPSRFPYDALLVVSTGKAVRERTLRQVNVKPYHLDALPGERIVLLGHGPTGDARAQIYGRDGRRRKSFDAGRCLEFMMADRRNNLWTAYGDEGVYDDPISAPGVVRWDSGGNRLWGWSAPQGIEYIDTVYAFNVTEMVAWAVYHPTFPLLEARADGRFHVRKNPVRSPLGMAVQGDQLLFLGGDLGVRDSARDRLHRCRVTDDEVAVVEEAVLTGPGGTPLKNYGHPVGRGPNLYLPGRSARQWYVLDLQSP